MKPSIGQPTARALWIAGKLEPKRREPRPCSNGWHAGEPRDIAEMDAMADARPDCEFTQVWRTQATCSKCGHTVSRDQFRQRSA